MTEEVDNTFCIIEEEDAEIFLGKRKLSSDDREFLEIPGVDDL